MSSFSLSLSPGAWSEHYRGRVQASEAFSRIRFSDQTNETADADAHAPASIESRARAALFGRSFVYVYKEDSGRKTELESMKHNVSLLNSIRAVDSEEFGRPIDFFLRGNTDA